MDTSIPLKFSRIGMVISLRSSLLFAMLFIFLVSSCSLVAGSSSNNFEISVSLTIRVRDYLTDLPVSNISVSTAFYLPGLEPQELISQFITDETTDFIEIPLISFPIYSHGDLQEMSLDEIRAVASQMCLNPYGGSREDHIKRILLASQSATDWWGFSRFRSSRLRSLKVSGNYTVIKVLNIFLNDEYHEAEYVPDTVSYENLQIYLSRSIDGNHVTLECYIWVLEGHLVEVFDCNPITGNPEILVAKPAVKSNFKSEYGSYYLFPLNYEVTIFHDYSEWSFFNGRRLNAEDPISPLRLVVGVNTTMVNWMFHASKDYFEREEYLLERRVVKLSSAGYYLEREIQEYEAIIGLFGRVSNLYREAQFDTAIAVAEIANGKMDNLVKWLADLETMAFLTTFGVSFFAYGFASLLSYFLFEESSENRFRLITKVLLFAIAMIVFSFAHPSLKITFSSILQIRKVGLTSSFVGCFIVSGLTYFLFQTLSVKKTAMSDLALQLGVRSLKRRRSRTLLTLSTLTIIVASSIVFVNISLNRESRVKDVWEGSDDSGIIVIGNILAPLSSYDVDWVKEQEWCEELTYTEGVKRVDYQDEWSIYRFGMLSVGEENYTIDIVGVDPIFMEEHYGMSDLINGRWDDFSSGGCKAILPSALGVVGSEFFLFLEENWGDLEDREIVKYEDLDEFSVVGVFDPAVLAPLSRIDGTPLFEDSSKVVLIPLESIENPRIAVSSILVFTRDTFDLVKIAEKLAYVFSTTVIANMGGVAQKIEWSTEYSIRGLAQYAPSLVIAGLMVYNTMVSVYEERKKEFSTLATLGLDTGNTFGVFLVESILLGLTGTFLAFVGSFLLGLALSSLALFFKFETPAFSLVSANWSMPGILVALIIGVVLVFFGGYFPAMKAQGLSLMGRVKIKIMIGEFVSESGITRMDLPIRETIQNADMMYTYIRENIHKFKKKLVNPKSFKGEKYRDGTFKASFQVILGGGVMIPFEIGVTRHEETLVPFIEFPSKHKNYILVREIVREFEKFMISYSIWKEQQLKMTIIRKTPEKHKSIEEILTEIKTVIKEIEGCEHKLRILEGQKGTLSQEIYNEFRTKYQDMINQGSEQLRSIIVNLEPHHKELLSEIGKIKIQVERLTVAHSLGESTDEEYVRLCGPLQANLDDLNGKVTEIENIFNFLKKPLVILS